MLSDALANAFDYCRIGSLEDVEELSDVARKLQAPCAEITLG